MASLRDIKPGSHVRGITQGSVVEIVSVEWIGDQAIIVVYRSAEGNVAETTLYTDDEHQLSVESTGRNWAFDADGEALKLVTEANQIKLAHFFDPYLAIHTSQVDPLPHQISAVYGEIHGCPLMSCTTFLYHVLVPWYLRCKQQIQLDHPF